MRVRRFYARVWSSYVSVRRNYTHIRSSYVRVWSPDRDVNFSYALGKS